MKQKLTFSFIIFLTMLSLSVLSQTKSQNDSSTVIIFNSGSTPSKTYNEKNIIKIAPISFITGKFPITYERKITDFLSLQVGVGLTSRDYLRTAINHETALQESEGIRLISENLPPNITDASDNLFKFDNRKPAMGYMISIQPRVYFDSEALEGMFMGLSYDMMRYNFYIPGLTYNGFDVVHNGEKKNEFENIQDFNAFFGSQYLFDRITLEYFLGIGMRSVKGEKYAAGRDYNTHIIYEGVSQYNQKTINLSAGLKVGYLF